MRKQTSQAAQDNIHHVEGVMISLMQKLSKLAPHPDRKSANGTAMVSINSTATPAADYDGMLGSLGLDAGLSGAFGAAAVGEAASTDMCDTSSPMQALDSQSVLDAASEYLRDKDATNNQGRGKGTIALGEHKTICNTFNTLDERQVEMNAFFEDHEERILLEKHLVSCDRQLSLLKRPQQCAPAFTPQFGLAA